MTEAQPVADNRLERRKMRTRAALIRAAQGFIAAGKLNVPVLEITQAADVGMGSFYNHFDSKEELFQAAVNEALNELGAILDKLTGEGEDPAETFARSFRLVGQLFRRRPEMSRVLLNTGLTMISADRGLTPRALRDISAAADAGRFTVDDPVTWVKPWTVQFPMTRSREPIFEYACHEGNYSLPNILAGARAAEQQK